MLQSQDAREIFKNCNDKKSKKRECNTRTSQEVTHPSTFYSRPSTLKLRSSDGIRCFSAGMIASDIQALLHPLILAPRHPETTHGPRTTASCKYFTTPHPYRSECYNRRMCGKYSRIVTTQHRKKGNATRGLPRRSPILLPLSPKLA